MSAPGPTASDVRSRHGLRGIIAALFTCIALASVAHAQSVRWETADQGALSTTLQLVFEDCAPDGQPALPTVPGVTFTFAGQAESMNIVNFQMTRSVTLTYTVRTRQNTPVQIPAFNVKTNKGVLRVPAFNVAAPTASVDSVATAKLVPEKSSVWAGEIFGLVYELSASRRNNPQISPTFDWNSAPLVAEEWSKYEITETESAGERRVIVTFRTRAVAKTPGSVKLEPANHMLSIQTGTIGFGGFGMLSQPRMEPVSVTSNQPEIEVRPLPAPPAGFTGAVGQFTLTSKVVPEKAAVGEPITWTLELSGTGNWPDIAGLPAREVSNDFQVVQPEAKRTPAEGKLFTLTLTEDVVLVPTKSGSYPLGPVSFTYFDPETASYKTVSTPRTTVEVTAPPPPRFATPSTGNQETGTRASMSTDPDSAAGRAAISSATPPAGIPRDPLPGSDEARVPLSRNALIAWLLTPFAALLIFWAWLAIRRAKETDPVRPRREARDRMVATLSHLHASTDADRATLLLAWQRDAAILWQIRRAAPRATAFEDKTWATLWSEADRVLYGRAPLPSDWIARAQEALAAKHVPGFKPLRLFLPQNLMPFAASIAFAMLATAVFVRAADESPKSKSPTANPGEALAAYAKGEFAATEKIWRAAITRTPTDWIARHNVSLALAQQERPAESAAQAAAAFVQNPDEPSVRWHFAQAAERSGFASPTLAAFIDPGPQHALARSASPATWQIVLILAAFVAAAALGWMLFDAYGQRRRMATSSALAILALSVVTAGGAATGFLTYGTAGKIDAVVVARAGTLRSIPTEADTTQKTTALSPGTLAIVDKTFLAGRWLRLAFDNGQTGWVRKDDVVPLWK